MCSEFWGCYSLVCGSLASSKIGSAGSVVGLCTRANNRIIWKATWSSFVGGYGLGQIGEMRLLLQCQSLAVKAGFKEMEKIDPAVVTKSLANNFNEFIEKLSSQSSLHANAKANANIEMGEPAIATGSDNSREGIGAKGSFTLLLKKPMTSKAVRLSMMKNAESVTGANVAIPLPAVEEVSKRFKNTMYGYFIGKRLSFPVVENYVKNAWEKFGLERAMLSNGFFFFQFYSWDRMERVLENGPWLIQIGLSLITSQIGNPIMLDAYNSKMCQKSWGKNSYARALVEVSSLNPLQDSLVVAIPFPDGSGHLLESIEVEYKWTPPRCETCKIFDHVDDACPKRVKVVVQSQVKDDGFTKVNNRKNKKKQQSTNQQGSNRQVAGMKLTKPKLNLVYKAVNKQVTDKGTSSQPVERQSKLPPKHAEKENLVSLSNSFETLNEFEDAPPIKKVYGSTDVDNLLSDDEEDIENVYDETILNASKKKCFKGGKHSLSGANDNVHGLCSKVFKRWNWTSHSLSYMKGSRIIMGWNSDILNAVVIASDDQIMHTALWKNLKTHKGYVRGRPWVVLGDFNVSLSADEKSTGSSYIDTGMRDFQECVEDIEPYRTSDHAPAVVRIPMNSMKRPHAFKFFNLFVHNTRFKEVVSNVWHQTISGFWMFKVVRCLKLLKNPLRKLLFDHGNIHKNVKKLRHLDEAQQALDSDPSNVELREEEAAYLHAYQDAILMEERLLVQKAKIDWLKLGDANTAYFHNVVKSQTARNRIDSIVDNNGATIDGDQVPLAFIDHYTEFLGANSMIREISDQEIKDTMFSMGDNKASGPDGFSAAFFKEAWDIIRVDVCKAIKEFFTNGILLKELNHTIITLIPKDILTGFGFHHRMIGWIMECVTTTSFSLSINGCSHGFFKGLVSRTDLPIINCSKLNIINLCFDDDLFLFAHGDENSARVIMDSLEEFKNASGLTPSLLKSTAYFYNVLNYVKIKILSILPFEKGILPVKHLGVPLVPSRLVYRNCLELMERIKKRINDWKNKVLSFAGRTHLIRLVLGSMHVYWASIFILLSSLMHDLEQVSRGFLWCQGEMKRGKAKVAWEVVCLPKKEGGLESLWVKWAHLYKLNRKSFWDIPLHGNMSWGWRKILQVLSLVRPFFWSLIGDGKYTFACFDNWSAASLLSNLISNRDIYRAGLGCNARVSDIVLADSWVWPSGWLVKYHPLANIVVHNLTNAADCYTWLNRQNMEVGYSVAAVWECIRPRNNEIDWFNVVWFNHQIPRHAIHLWLVIKRKLKTQDTLRKSARSVTLKLVFAAACYFLWQERNNRLFKKTKRTQDQICGIIKDTGNLYERRLEECYDLIKNITAHHNDWDTSAHRGESSSSTTSSSEIANLAQQMIEMRKDMLQMYRSNQQVNYVTLSCETCGGPHSYYECQAIGGYTQDVYATTGNYNSGGNSYQPQGYRDLLSYRSKNFLGPSSFNNQNQGEIKKALFQRPEGALPSNTTPNPRADIKAITTRSGVVLAGPSVPPPSLYSSSKEVEQDLETITDHVLTETILLKKLPKKLRDPGKFLIPRDFPQFEKCMALADLGANINLMPLSLWKKLMLPELIPTRMILELVNRFVAYPAGIAEDVCIQVGKFTFPTNFVVIDYDVDPLVPFILGRPFLRMAHALVDVYGEELILRDGDEKLIFHADSISKHPQKHGNNGNGSRKSSSSANSSRRESLVSKGVRLGKESERGVSTDSSPKTDIDIIDPILERITYEITLVYSSPSGDDDDDLFDLKSNNEEWKKLFYGDLFDNTHSENEKDKDLKIECLINNELELPALHYGT
uniref:Reverse transcriptase domain-containing protein n=1 Tax=Tanacetum cinerariifolium TaxID=118510 RepID=A0A6L2LHQ3_TANCI|nr:hypothetical protein [Tanacetum cinerariifolium]